MSEDRVPEVTRYEYPENASDVTIEGTATSNQMEDQPKPKKKKITIEVDEDDPCLQDKKVKEDRKVVSAEITVAGLDPRFQQQDQTVRCWVMYTDFYRCEHILGAGSNACSWFKQVFTTICPNDWIDKWEKLRTEGKLPWHKYKTQGNFPGDKYGV